MAAPSSPAYAAFQSDAQRTYTTPQDFYRLRDFGQKFEAAFAFLKKHGGNLYRVMLVPLLLALVPLVIVAVLFARNFNPAALAGRAGLESGLLLMMPAFFGLGVLILAALMAQFVLLYGFVKLRMRQPDPAVSIAAAEAWNEGKRYLLPLIGYSVVAAVLVTIGLFLLFLPGIYLATVLVLLPSVVVFEDADLGTSFSRCFALIKGKWWSTFGLYMIAYVAIAMVSGGVGMVITIISTVLSLKDPSGNATVVGIALAQSVQMGINLLLYPVLYVLLMFQYFNLVERHDHVSLQWQAEQLGQTPGGPTGADPTPDDNLFRPSYGDQAL